MCSSTIFLVEVASNGSLLQTFIKLYIILVEGSYTYSCIKFCFRVFSKSNLANFYSTSTKISILIFSHVQFNSQYRLYDQN